MIDFAKVYMNISMEGVCLINMIILLVTILTKKRKLPANKTFIDIIGIEIALLIVQIAQWILIPDAMTSALSHNRVLMTYAFYNIDFSLVYFSVLIFFRYVFDRVKEANPSAVNEKALKNTYTFLTVFSCVICLIYLSSIWTGIIYTFDTNGYLVYDFPIYSTILNSSIIIVIVCLCTIIKHWKALGNTTSLIMLSFLFARLMVLPIDLRHNTSFSYIFPAFEILILYFGVDLRKEKMLQEQETQIAKKNAELEVKNNQIMVSQIQPHFLYNTLSVIDCLCDIDPALAQKAINAFSDYLRMNMDSITSLKPVPFEKELEHTKTYLWIEKLRFDDILNIEYDIEETDFMIPSLSIQPLCENAVKYGIRGKENGGTIKVSTKRKGSKIYITIEDTGIGFDPDIKPDDGRTHVGIENVRNRLMNISGGSLEITSKIGEGTKAVIILEDKNENIDG